MARYRTTIHSNKPTDVAFAYLADFSQSVEWDPGVVRAKRVDDGQIELSSRFDLVTKFAGRELPLTYEITGFEMNKFVEFTATTSTFSSVDRVTFSPTDEGCDVTYDADLRPRGLMRLADPFLSMAFRRIGERARLGLQLALRR